MSFKEQLIHKGFGKNTATNYQNFIEKKFNVFLLESFLSIESFEHDTLMQYIRHRKSQGIGAKTINIELKKISYYLDFKELPNVAEPIRVKGVQRRIPHDLFTEKQLDNIYQQVPRKPQLLDT